MPQVERRGRKAGDRQWIDPYTGVTYAKTSVSISLTKRGEEYFKEHQARILAAIERCAGLVLISECQKPGATLISMNEMFAKNEQFTDIANDLEDIHADNFTLRPVLKP